MVPRLMAGELEWTEEGPRKARWISESGAAPPTRVRVVDDRLPADAALKLLRRGEALLYRGDFRNARQLLASVGRRVGRERSTRFKSALDAFRAERTHKLKEARLLGGLLVELDEGYRPVLRTAPDVTAACAEAWGPPPPGTTTVTALRELLGVMGAAEWRRKGLEVPGLRGRIHPHYGVFSPTRTEYVSLVAAAPRPIGKRVYELGTGTGVLACLLAQEAAAHVVATDLDPRAVACARENVERLGLSDRIEVQERDLFPEGTADLIVFNPPWIPETPRTPMDRAIYDPGGALLSRFLEGVSAHLAPGGEAWLVISDLAERIGLRLPGALEREIDAAGLEVIQKTSTVPTHGRAKDREDPLHEARSSERTSLYRLVPASRA